MEDSVALFIIIIIFHYYFIYLLPNWKPLFEKLKNVFLQLQICTNCEGIETEWTNARKYSKVQTVKSRKTKGEMVNVRETTKRKIWRIKGKARGKVLQQQSYKSIQFSLSTSVCLYVWERLGSQGPLKRTYVAHNQAWTHNFTTGICFCVTLARTNTDKDTHTHTHVKGTGTIQQALNEKPDVLLAACSLSQGFI